jgi:hypothetical protein
VAGGGRSALVYRSRNAVWAMGIKKFGQKLIVLLSDEIAARCVLFPALSVSAQSRNNVEKLKGRSIMECDGTFRSKRQTNSGGMSRGLRPTVQSVVQVNLSPSSLYQHFLLLESYQLSFNIKPKRAHREHPSPPRRTL